MKAAVYSEYGPPAVVAIQEVPKPAPKDDEILVRVRATTVCAADWRLRKADPPLIRLMNGLSRPKKHRILGMEFSGVVEAVGKAVTLFAPGDEVFGLTEFKFGAHAEYLCMPEKGAVGRKPVKMTFDEAAAVMFGGVSALHFLGKANIKAGQRVLIYGASGSVGVFSVQIAKYFGARVTAVCSTANLELVKSLGADEALDYTKEDFSSAGRVYDVVLDTVGYSGFARSLRSVKRGGVFLRVMGSLRPLGMIGEALRAIWLSITGTAKVVGGVAGGAVAAVPVLTGLIDSGKLRTVIDRRYSLAEIAEAHRHAEGGHKRGHVVIVVEPTSPGAHLPSRATSSIR